MSKYKQIDKILIALDSVKWNLGLIKKSIKKKNIKNKYAMKHIYESIFCQISIINKTIDVIFEELCDK